MRAITPTFIDDENAIAEFLLSDLENYTAPYPRNTMAFKLSKEFGMTPYRAKQITKKFLEAYRKQPLMVRLDKTCREKARLTNRMKLS